MKQQTAVHRGKFQLASERFKTILSTGLLGTLLLSSVMVAMGQVYGVRRTAVVKGPNTTVVASKTTVVAGGAALPHGYIAVLPSGYRAVVVSGARYYTVGGVYYRPQIYGGRTVYVRVHI
ncbi:MAG TPA: hypothetical protein VIR01_14070 [Pyrinomonadaceae bacterium]|jgi:hypothetical protein